MKGDGGQEVAGALFYALCAMAIAILLAYLAAQLRPASARAFGTTLDAGWVRRWSDVQGYRIANPPWPERRVQLRVMRNGPGDTESRHLDFECFYDDAGCRPEPRDAGRGRFVPTGSRLWPADGGWVLYPPVRDDWCAMRNRDDGGCVR